jgi:starch-binding outer membrane protein, SusD/RagB family
MKKINIYLTVFLLAFVPVFSSCSLDLEPEDATTRDNFWQTKEEVKNAVMGCYAAMMDYDAMQRYFLWGELRADLVTVTSRASVALSNGKNGDIASTDFYTDWSSIYTVINNCNTVLYFAKETQKIDQSFSDDLLKEYEAEVTCIRALMYFYLVRTFGDVPYVTEPSLSDDQDYFVAKTPKAEILTSLIADLKSVDRTQNTSSKGIPYTYSTAIENKGRFTVWSLKALLADIYLWNEDYQNCASECGQIINSGQFSLVKVGNTEAEVEDASATLTKVYYPSEGDADNLFLNMYAKGNSVESIFELQFTGDYENPFYTYFNPTNGVFAANTEVLSKNELFMPSNVDRGWYDIRGEGVSYRQGLVWKWIGLSRSSYTYRALGESYSNWIFYRLADVYLMKAEALTQLGKSGGDATKLTEALALVHQIRLRSTAPESTDQILEGATIDPSALEDFILTERSREFAHEGKRWFDVLRNAKRGNYGGINYLLTLAAYAASPDKAVGLQNKWKGDYNSHYLPINESELKKNKALVQNSFYAK